MLYPAHRTILTLVAALLVLCPTAVLAEVSDKEPATGLFWTVGLAAAGLCLLSARVRPWLGALVFAPAALWFFSLFSEIHSPDIGPYLRLEQGDTYYWQAYAAFAIVPCGLVLGYLWHKHQSS